jgi:hypothetical protein
MKQIIQAKTAYRSGKDVKLPTTVSDAKVYEITAYNAKKKKWIEKILK